MCIGMSRDAMTSFMRYISDESHLAVISMKPRSKKVCEVCVKSFSSANIARHKRCMHSYCLDCKILVSRKRHHCFKSVGQAPPKEEEQYLLAYVPILIHKQLYKKLEVDNSVWPLHDFGKNEDLADKVKTVLKRDCFTCCVSEFMDVPDDRHSCTDPNRDEFVTALRQCTDNTTDQIINDVYRAAFGGLVL